MSIELLEPRAHLRARTRAGEESVGRHQPVATRLGHLAGEDLDPVAALQPVVERPDPAVDLGTAAAMADVGIHVIGEVQRRGAARQVDDPDGESAVWGKSVALRLTLGVDRIITKKT